VRNVIRTDHDDRSMRLERENLSDLTGQVFALRADHRPTLQRHWAI
jgi:hypothetical protein